ncbi:bifunctional GNAT family N-acetyltransferase/carbon-nitrogen hydrolase family protein [Desulfonatronum thioautotrophicum]|uniref:bifunctional GNAT family N-acetyltransferase/carbon-nitrogen hydrolase family protein n=1 Tax=Desulfonatronum thioautotrophicum TaxID=617001 RepID=UPI0005EBA5D7|nr:bifunctional GNAT family N-acetyltransferase/carbon-nitrogen hydrolase family protein [Desulfonatronum thioautotrophicum]
MTKSISHKLNLRNLRSDDYQDLQAIMQRVYRTVDTPWEKEQIEAMIRRFPEGQICIEDKGRAVAVALTMMIDYADYVGRHTYLQVVGDGTLGNHDPEGDYLYGIEIIVDPEFQGMRLGRRLYDARKELCEKLNLRGIIVGGRIPGYRKFKEEISPQEYINRVKRKEIYDPVLSFQLSNDFHIKRLLRNYYPSDHQSEGNAVLLEWNNIYYEARTRLIGGRKTVVRLGTVQWQMRRFASFDDFQQQVEFFVDTVSDYGTDLVLFPELFNAPLIAQYEEESPPEAMRRLGEYTEVLREELMRLALAYNINIVSGSVPEYRDHKLYNVSFLCRRDGTWDAQYKLHITPEENRSWGLTGGESLRTFDTDIGRIGILICYDIEFPELARLLVERGANILLVPFWTDTKNAYLRVRRCAQARAIENECYVVISGSVGNIPKVETMGIQYSQSAIFTPSDFAFPHDAIAAETTPNTETTLITDVDLDLLKELRRQGSVRNMKSRRRDLYRLKWIGD